MAAVEAVNAILDGDRESYPRDQIDPLIALVQGRATDAVADFLERFAAFGHDESSARERSLEFLDDLLFLHSTDAWRVLGLERGMELETVRQRYRRLLRIFHPDRARGREAWADERTHRLNEAFRAIESGEADQPDPVLVETARAGARYDRPPVGSEIGQRVRGTLGPAEFFQRRALRVLVALSAVALTLIWVAGLFEEDLPTPGPSPSVVERTPRPAAAVGGSEGAAKAPAETTRTAAAPVPDLEPAIDPARPDLATRDEAPAVTGQLSSSESQARPLQPPSPTTALESDPGVARAEVGVADEPAAEPRPTDTAVAPAPVATTTPPTRSPAIHEPTSATVAETAPARAEPTTAVEPPPRIERPRSTERAANSEPVQRPPPGSAWAIAAERSRALDTAEEPPAAAPREAPIPTGEAPLDRRPAAVIDVCATARARTPDFVRHYEDGTLDAFVALYAEDAVENDARGIDAVRTIYQDFFARTSDRRMALTVNRTTVLGGTVCLLTMDFDTRFRTSAGEQLAQSGRLKMYVAVEGGKPARIVRLQY